MSITIKQSASQGFKKPKGAVTYFPGVGLADLLDYLTELQAHGVPDNACIVVQELNVKADWEETR